MARSLVLYSEESLAALKTTVDFAMLSLLNIIVRSAIFVAADDDARLKVEYQLLLEVETGGPVMGSPFTFEYFNAPTAQGSVDGFNAFLTAHPGEFISPPFYDFISMSTRKLRVNPVVAVANVDPNAASNWLASGGAGGAFVTVNYGGQEEFDVIASSGAAATLDMSVGNGFDIVLTDNCTFTITGPVVGKLCSILIVLRQDAVGGRTVAWPASVLWPGSTPPVLTAAANGVDIVSMFTNDGGVSWFGNPGLPNMG